MRAVIQRVSFAEVCVDGQKVSEIKKGLLAYIGVSKEDTEQDQNYLAEKIPLLRIFEDENGKLNLSLKDIGGELLVVSQFTLYGDCRKGRRPGFDAAMPPQEAKLFFEQFVNKLREQGIPVQTGVFQAHMLVKSENDGPVTILLDSKKIF